MHHISPRDVLAQRSKQSGRHRIPKQLVAIANLKTIDGDIAIVGHLEISADSVSVGGQNPDLAAKLRQPTAQSIAGAYGPSVCPGRIERGAHMKNFHAAAICQLFSAVELLALERWASASVTG